jgi:hypothetical protein
VPRFFDFRDSFGLVLILLVATMLVIAILGETQYGGALAVAIQALAVLIIYQASSVPRKGMMVAAAIAAVAVVGATAANYAGGQAAGTVASLALMFLLLLGPYVIAKRLRDFTHVGAETVFAALCIYLIIGMFFSVLYLLVGTLDPEPFFTEAPDPSGMDSLYFSFTTLTTLGYGDLTPAGDVARMLAITEALLGQVYLVTVVALIVTNLGRNKSRRGLDDNNDLD